MVVVWFTPLELGSGDGIGCGCDHLSFLLEEGESSDLSEPSVWFKSTLSICLVFLLTYTMSNIRTVIVRTRRTLVPTTPMMMTVCGVRIPADSAAAVLDGSSPLEVGTSVMEIGVSVLEVGSSETVVDESSVQCNDIASSCQVYNSDDEHVRVHACVRWTCTCVCPYQLELELLMMHLHCSLHAKEKRNHTCLLYTSPSPRDATLSRMPSSA